METLDAYFDFQLEMLKKELDHLNTTVDKIDTIAQSIKYWTIVLWGGAIVLAIGKRDNSTYFEGQYLITSIIPFLFWFVDGWYRRIQRSFIFRINQIAKFLNSEDLAQSFKQRNLIGIRLYDLRGRMSGDRKELLKFTSIWKTMFFPSVSIFYLGLVIFSILTEIFMKH